MLPVRPLQLEDLQDAGASVQPRADEVAGESFHLQPEWDPPLPTVLLGSEFCRNAVNLDKYSRVPGGIPQEAHGAQVSGVLSDLRNAVAERGVYLQYSLVRMRPRPLGYLLRLNVLQASLVETNPESCAEPLLLIMPCRGREILVRPDMKEERFLYLICPPAS